MNRSVDLHIPADEAFLPLVTTFAEKAALTFGLPQRESLSLHLAVEEIFLHIANFVQPVENVEITCAPASCGVRAVFEFPANKTNLGAFNITTSCKPDKDTDFHRLGLFLAAHSVEHLKIERPQSERIRLTLEKEKPYSVYDRTSAPSSASRTEFITREPEAAEMGLVAKLVVQCYGPGHFPEFFKYPQRLVDMNKGSELSAIIGVDPGGLIGGALLWRWLSLKTVECYGPYLFGAHQQTNLNQELVETLLQRLARSNCISLVNQYANPDLPAGYFHTLGSLETGQDGLQRNVLLRMLHEDPGSLVWSKPPLSDFLRKTYDRLALPREIQDPGLTAGFGEEESVLFAQIAQLDKTVMLTPGAIGQDIASNLENHVRLLKHKEMSAIFFQLDLGQSAQTTIIDPLDQLGFVPKLIIPYGGQGDLVTYQLRFDHP
jgi:hypothetical protein